MASIKNKGALRYKTTAKSSSSAPKKAAKRSIRKRSKSIADEAGSNPVKQNAGKSPGKRLEKTLPRSAKKSIMASFKGARPSDVSDKVFVATSTVHGKGLFAAKRIKANTVLGRLHGMPTFEDGIYVLWITDELGLELTNDLKYINHCSEPNAAYSDLDVTVLRDVEPGEELLHDYGW